MPQSEFPKETIEITERFYRVVDDLIIRREIRGLGTLAEKWGVSRFTLSRTRTLIDKKRLNVEYLYYIIRDYNVSPTWLMMGAGQMYRK